MRTNHPIKAAEARHRKPGPPHLGGGSGGGKRAREVNETDDTDSTGREDQPVNEEDPSWHQTASGQ